MDIYYIYILASRHHNYISITVTAELEDAIRIHRNRINHRLGRSQVFQKLVYVEAVRGAETALGRQRQLRKFSFEKIAQLIELVNPCWEGISLSALSKSGYSRIRALL